MAFRENAFRNRLVDFIHLQSGIAGFLHPVVPTPAIGRNGRSLGYARNDGGTQGRCGRIRNLQEADAPYYRDLVHLVFLLALFLNLFGLNRNKNDSFAECTSSSFTFLRCPKIGLIGLNSSGKSGSPWVNHGSAQLVETKPRGIVTGDSKTLLQVQGTNPSLARADIPHCPKPDFDRKVRTVENGSGQDGLLSPTTCTEKQAVAHLPIVVGSTFGANKTIRPPQSHKVVVAVRVGLEPLLKLCERMRILLACHGWIFYILWLVESTA